MNEFLIVILAILFLTYLGKVIFRLFGFLKDLPDYSLLPFGFSFGSALVALQLYFYSRIHVKWNLLYVIAPWLVFLIIAAIIKKELLLFKVKKNNIKFKLFDKILIIFLIMLVGFVGFESVLRPLSAWDGWASWLFKSKMFYIDGSITSNSLKYSESDYPLIISLIGTFIYIILGRVNDTAVLLYFFGCYIFLGLGLFTGLKNKIGVSKSLLFTFLLLSLQNLIRHGGRFEAGYADLPLALYIFLSSLLLLRFKNKTDKSTFILLQIFLGITALIKNEGFFFSLVVELIVFLNLYKIKKTRLFPFLLFWLVPIIDWNIFKIINKVPQNFLLINLQNHLHLDKVFLIFLEFIKEFINFQNWNILWIVFFVCLIYSFLKKKINMFYSLTLVQLLLYIMIFTISPVDPIIHVRNIVDRLFIHLAPLAVYAIALTNYEISK